MNNAMVNPVVKLMLCERHGWVTRNHGQQCPSCLIASLRDQLAEANTRIATQPDASRLLHMALQRSPTTDELKDPGRTFGMWVGKKLEAADVAREKVEEAEAVKDAMKRERDEARHFFAEAYNAATGRNLSGHLRPQQALIDIVNERHRLLTLPQNGPIKGTLSIDWPSESTMKLMLGRLRDERKDGADGRLALGLDIADLRRMFKELYDAVTGGDLKEAPTVHAVKFAITMLHEPDAAHQRASALAENLTALNTRIKSELETAEFTIKNMREGIESAKSNAKAWRGNWTDQLKIVYRLSEQLTTLRDMVRAAVMAWEVGDPVATQRLRGARIEADNFVVSELDDAIHTEIAQLATKMNEILRACDYREAPRFIDVGRAQQLVIDAAKEHYLTEIAPFELPF